jgi:hypothetical protein
MIPMTPTLFFEPSGKVYIGFFQDPPYTAVGFKEAVHFLFEILKRLKNFPNPESSLEDLGRAFVYASTNSGKKGSSLTASLFFLRNHYGLSKKGCLEGHPDFILHSSPYVDGMVHLIR